MADKLIRVGRVSKIDYENAMISVTYPDLDDAVTSLLSVVSFNDEYQMPEVGDEVLAVHLPSGQARGLVLGKYWNSEHKPAVTGKGKYRKEYTNTPGEAYSEYSDAVLLYFAPEIRFTTESGSITVSEIIQMKNDIENLTDRVAAVEARV